MLGKHRAALEGGGSFGVGFLFLCRPHPRLQHIDTVSALGQIEVAAAQRLGDFPVLPLRIEAQYPLAAFEDIDEQQLEQVAFALAGVAEDEKIGVALVLGAAVQVGDDGTAIFVIADIKSAGVGLAGVGKREQIGHAGGGEHSLELFPKHIPAGGHHRKKSLLLAEEQPVHADFRPAQFCFHTVPQLGKFLFVAGDEFDVNSGMEKRFPIALGGADHGGDVLQIALGLHCLPDVGAAALVPVGLIRRLQDFAFLAGGDQPCVDPQGDARPFPQPLEDGLLLGGSGVSPYRPDAPPAPTHQIPVHLELNGAGGDEVKEALENPIVVHDAGGLVVALAVFQEPPLAVEIIIALADDILGEVDREDTLEVVVSRPPHRKPLLSDEPFQPPKVGEDLPFPDVSWPDDEDKFPCGGGVALDLVQMAHILFQQTPDGGGLLPLDPPGQIPLVVFKALAGAEAEQFHLREALEDMHKGVDPRFQVLPGQHRHIGGLDEKENNLVPIQGDEAVIGDLSDVHEPAGIFITSLAFPFSEQIVSFDDVSPPMYSGPSGRTGAAG